MRGDTGDGSLCSTDLSYDANGNMIELNGYTFSWTNRRLTSAKVTQGTVLCVDEK